jgi:hypothetical protein
MAPPSRSPRVPSSPYKPLPPEYIRILQLHPGPIDAPLVCNIVYQHIGSEPYDALSYVWGDPAPAAYITCVDEKNEAELGIGRAFAEALIAFRLLDRPRSIWVDALCINQKDVTERHSQVRMMGAIYAKAEHVLSWLGPFDSQDKKAKSRARLAIDFLRRFNENQQEHLREARTYFHSDEDTVDTDGPLVQSWLAIKELFDLEYFHRAWIIQEVGLAQNARLFWGTKDIWLDWIDVSKFCNFMDFNGASIINHWQLKSWVANHINLVWATDASGTPIHTFVEVLHWARVHRSTDPRDYIYALLSHPSAKVNGSLLVQPNYTITPAQAYIEFAVNVIERMNSLEILAFVDHHEDFGVLNLPTWVPDWHALNLVAPLRYPTQAASRTDNSITILDSEKGMTLRCHGYFIDTLRVMSNVMEPSELVITTLDKEIKKKIPFLVDHIWIRTVVEADIPLVSLEHFLASLSLLLTGGYLNESASTSGENKKQQQSDFALLILEYERIRPNDHSNSFFASLSLEEKAVIRNMGARGSAHQFVQDMTWNSMCRRIFRTAKGHFGLGPRIMKEGDICAVIRGAVYPMVMRKCNDRFQLVGPALIYGYMNGEAENLCHNGILLEQFFEII